MVSELSETTAICTAPSTLLKLRWWNLRMAIQAGRGCHASRRGWHNCLWAYQCAADPDCAILWRVSVTSLVRFVHASPSVILITLLCSQPFWGNVVASAGAGPAPIPQKELKVSVLVQGFNYLTSAPAAEAARAIAQKMRSETGVQAAVESFHRHLPRDAMSCDVTRSQVARWTVSKNKRVVKLSDQAVAVLIARKLIKLNELEP